MEANGSRSPRVDGEDTGVYYTADLDYFDLILRDIIVDYESVGSLSVSDRKYLREKLAAAIFKCAATGERDYTRLRSSALEAVSPVPFSWPGS